MYVDTHTHIYLKDFDDDRKQIINECKKLGVTKLLLPNIDSNSMQDVIKISNEFKIINTRLEKTVFSPGHKVVPMLETFIKTDTGTYPVNMTVYSNTYDSNGVKTGEKSYSGEILYGYISNQALTTVKVWPHGTELNDIEKNAKDHLRRESRRDDVTVFEIEFKSTRMEKKKNKNAGIGIGLGSCFGVVFGAAYGITIGNISAGTGMGLAIGVLIGAIFDFVKK